MGSVVFRHHEKGGHPMRNDLEKSRGGNSRAAAGHIKETVDMKDEPNEWNVISKLSTNNFLLDVSQRNES